MGTRMPGGVGPIVVSVPFTVTANTTVRTGVFAANGSYEVLAADVTFYAAPVTSGTVTIAMSNRDYSATATDNLLSASTVALEGVTSLVPTALTLTATLADRNIDDGDFIYISLVSDNADMTGATGGNLTLILTPRSV